MLMDPMGSARRINSVMLEQLKHLNKTLKLGHMLCRSRKPDLLLQIIQRQGTYQSMPWLSDLVQNSDGEFHHLPVQCLCEFLLSNTSTFGQENSRNTKLLDYLRDLITEENSDKQVVCEILEYMFRRLSSTVKQSRTAALYGIKLLLNDPENWLNLTLTQLPYFSEICSFVIPQLRSACQVENSPELVMIYIHFIASHTQNDSAPVMLDHVMDMAQLIVERSTMFYHITNLSFCVVDDLNTKRLQTLKCLFVMFHNYIIKLREHHDTFECSQYPDLLMIRFEDGVQLPIHLNIIHAFVILLTHSSLNIPESTPILDYWFPVGKSAPQAFLPNFPNERVQFIPDWLKLKMIRSSVIRLIAAAMQELSPDQIVLFVQNFGTPVSSMSKLLALLDLAVIEQLELVKNSILNKAYLAQLIEIQQARGAKNGHVTVQVLELHSHSQTVPDLSKLITDKLHPVSLIKAKKIIADNTSIVNNFVNIESILNIVIKKSDLNVTDMLKFHNTLHLLLNRSVSPSQYHNDLNMYNTSYDIFHINRYDNFDKKCNNKHLCTILRAIYIHNQAKEQPIDILVNINNILQNFYVHSEYPLTKHERLFRIFQIKIKQFCKVQNTKEKKLVINLQMLHDVLSKVYHLQNSGRNIIYDIVKKNNTRILIENVINKLEACSSNNADIFYMSIEHNNIGILVDWMVEVDPEHILINQNVQLELLFSKTYKDYRYFLLSLLCHETNWNTLNITLNYLLKKFRSYFNQSAILNFIESLMNNPRLWKGRDKTISKNGQSDTLFVLDDMQIQVLIQYILEESQSELLKDSIKNVEKLSTRIDLLIRVSNKCDKFYNNCLKFVFNYPCNPILTLKVLELLYMMHPKIKFVKGEKREFYVNKVHNLIGFRSDKLANYLITCLGNLISKKDFESLSSDSELLMRKLAASHPTLFLRQLGVFCSQIQGKAHKNIRTLREEHHIHRFIQILRTFEVLQPLIFDDEYKHNLQVGLDCFFTFFKYHIRDRETYHMLIKFVELLQSYIKINPSSAFKFIEKYTSILQELALKFNYLLVLQQLVQGLSLLKHKSIISFVFEEEDMKQEMYLDEMLDLKKVVLGEPDSDFAIFPGILPQIDKGSKNVTSLAFSDIHKQTIHFSTNIFNLIQIIKHSDLEDVILGPLQEIESITSKRFSFLHELFDRLLDLIFSPSAQVRSNAYILLIRHLKNQPGRSDMIECTLNAFVQCLCDDNSSVASSAVDNLVDITILLQEYSVEILGVAFALGIKSKINTCNQIKKAMQTLLLQQGY